MRHVRLSHALTLALATLGTAAAAADTDRAQDVKITVLSTMLAEEGVGEWGFAALVEVDGYRLLFDTGAREETVLRNAEELKVDLTNVTDVLLSHHHADHTGGLLRLRQAKWGGGKALSRAHVASGHFLPRRRGDGDATERNPMIATRAAYEAGGGQIVEHARAEQLAPGRVGDGADRAPASRAELPEGIDRRDADGARGGHGARGPVAGDPDARTGSSCSPAAGTPASATSWRGRVSWRPGCR